MKKLNTKDHKYKKYKDQLKKFNIKYKKIKIENNNFINSIKSLKESKYDLMDELKRE